LIDNGLSNSWKALEYTCYGIETSSTIRGSKDKPGTIEGDFLHQIEKSSKIQASDDKAGVIRAASLFLRFSSFTTRHRSTAFVSSLLSLDPRSPRQIPFYSMWLRNHGFN
jgi:hypothetical protein